jgi:hypothetical protein
MNAISPRITEGFDLFGLAGNVILAAVLHIAGCRGPLEIRVESNSIRRVDIDALHPSAQPLALGEARHHRQAVAEDHSVRPVGVVLVELGASLLVGQTVEVGEQVRHWRVCFLAPLAGLPYLRVDIPLDIKRRSLNDQVGPILFVLTAPNELRVEIAIAPLIRDADRGLFLIAHHRLKLGGRYVASLIPVAQRGNRDLPAWHVLLFPSYKAGQAWCVLRGLAARGTSG